MLNYDGLKSKVLSEMRKVFNPEFLNRLDETIVFRSLEKTDIERIIEIMIDRLNDRLVDRGIVVHMDNDAKIFLVDEGYDSEYGARPMRRAIQRHIEDPLSSDMLSGNIPDGSDIYCTLNKDGNKLGFEVKSNTSPTTVGAQGGNEE